LSGLAAFNLKLQQGIGVVGAGAALFQRGLQRGRDVLEELALAVEALGLVAIERRQKLLVGQQGQVQHGPEEHGRQAQGVEQLDAEAAGGRVEDAQ